MLPSETMIWQPEFTDKTLSRKPGAVQRLKELERENRELRRSNDILRQASAYFAKAEFDRLWKK